VDRAPEANASSFALTGLVLGLTVDKRWFTLTGVVAFLLQHARKAGAAAPAIASPRCEDAQRNRPRKICPESLGGPERKCPIETVATRHARKMEITLGSGTTKETTLNSWGR